MSIFVFGSNLSGRHGKGAAHYALKKRGAIYGMGVGRQGDSYAIPTKDKDLRTLPLHEIEYHVRNFIKYAEIMTDLEFEVTPIGTGLGEYSHQEIAAMFYNAPSNCKLPIEWR